MDKENDFADEDLEEPVFAEGDEEPDERFKKKKRFDNKKGGGGFKQNRSFSGPPSSGGGFRSPSPQPRPSFTPDVPVKEGQEYTVVVESVGSRGDGVCKVNGFVVFVAGVQKGESVKIKITKVAPKFGIGQKV